MDLPHKTLFYFEFGSILPACAGAIVFVILASYVPRLRAHKNRTLMLGFGSLMLLTTLFQMILLHNANALPIAIAGGAMVLQGALRPTIAREALSPAWR